MASAILSNLAVALSKSKEIAECKNKLTYALEVGGINEVGVLELESTEQANQTKSLLSGLAKEVSQKANTITRMRMSKEEELDDFVAREDMEEIDALRIAEKEAMELQEEIQNYMPQIDDWLETHENEEEVQKGREEEEQQSSDQSPMSQYEKDSDNLDTDTDFEVEKTKKVIPRKDHEYGRKKTSDRPQCDTCGKTFFKNFNLKIHKEHCGQGVKAKHAVCQGCKASFSSSLRLQQHQKRSCKGQERTKVCPECSTVYGTAADMRKHLKRGCDGQKKRKGPGKICDQCQKSFSTPSNMRKHRLLCQGTDHIPCKGRDSWPS